MKRMASKEELKVRLFTWAGNKENFTTGQAVEIARDLAPNVMTSPNRITKYLKNVADFNKKTGEWNVRKK